MKAIVFVLLGILITALAFAWLAVLGWLITVVVAWFGPQLAVWQGMVIAFLISALAGGGSRLER